MDKRKQKKLKRKAAAYVPPKLCPNCGQPGSHFAPPCMGEEGFFICKSTALGAVGNAD